MSIEDADRIRWIGRRDELTAHPVDGVEMTGRDEAADADQSKARHGSLEDPLGDEDEIACAERDIVRAAAGDPRDRDDDPANFIAFAAREDDLSGVCDGGEASGERDRLDDGEPRGQRKGAGTRHRADDAHALRSEFLDKDAHLRASKIALRLELFGEVLAELDRRLSLGDDAAKERKEEGAIIAHLMRPAELFLAVDGH